MAVVGTCAVLVAGCKVKSNTTNINEPSDESATEAGGGDDKSSSPETAPDKESGVPEGGTQRGGLEPPSTPSSTDKATEKTDGPGKSESAPGHDPKGPGNSENAPGHNKETKDASKGQGKTGNKPTVDTNKETGTSASGKTPAAAGKK
jgi:hypothetical protein